MTISPRTWTLLAAFLCVVAAAVIMELNGLGRDENLRYRPTTEKNRVPAFFAGVLVIAGFCLFAFGPKGT